MSRASLDHMQFWVDFVWELYTKYGVSRQTAVRQIVEVFQENLELLIDTSKEYYE